VQVAAASPSARLPPKGWHRPSDVGLVVEGPERETLRRGRSWLTHRVAGVGVPLRVTGHGFWQPHAAAPAAYVSAVREVLAARPGETAADLYAGVGLFAAALAADVGPAGRVVAVESDRRASADALRALHAVPQVRLVRGRVLDALRAAEVPPGAAVVMDPPRAGAGLDVVDALVAVGPRAVAYVACDPAALARDLARFRAHGWVLTSLRAFDAFPMTHHVECVAGLTPPAPGAEPQVRHNVAGRGGSFGRSRAAGAP
jgi:tRNA/tmRNA/rRNA uracil-C5-methylase (TrmA/RlmC/RlmD family)